MLHAFTKSGLMNLHPKNLLLPFIAICVANHGKAFPFPLVKGKGKNPCLIFLA